MISRISRIILFVEDPAKIARFYEQHFGLRPTNKQQDDWIELQAGGCNLALHRSRSSSHVAAGSPVKLVFEVEDVQHAVEKYRAEGLIFGAVHSWNGIFYADTEDPEGNPIQISSQYLGLTS